MFLIRKTLILSGIIMRLMAGIGGALLAAVTIKNFIKSK